MKSATMFELRVAEHEAQVTRVNQEAWMREPAVSGGGRRTQGTATVVTAIRQRVGVALVHASERVHGTAPGRAIDHAAVV